MEAREPRKWGRHWSMYVKDAFLSIVGQPLRTGRPNNLRQGETYHYLFTSFRLTRDKCVTVAYRISTESKGSQERLHLSRMERGKELVIVGVVLEMGLKIYMG